jgi:hypothetical protein
MDERGRDKNQICNGGRRVKNGMRDNYRFILPVRASHFRSVSKTISIPEDLGCQHDWRTCHTRRGSFDASRKFWSKILGYAWLLILTSAPQGSFRWFWSLFSKDSEDGLHTLLNRSLRRILVTLTWNCYKNFLNLCLQHLTEAQLVIRSYCEVVHLGIDVLQEHVSGMNLLANFIIYPHLIPDDISERGLIFVEILPHTTLLAIV